MSHTTDGKISNQPFCRVMGRHSQILCSCCSTLIDKPKFCTLSVDRKDTEVLTRKPIKHIFSMYHYIDTPHYIYETKSGYSVVYCSDKCRKHNHRYKGKNK